MALSSNPVNAFGIEGAMTPGYVKPGQNITWALRAGRPGRKAPGVLKGMLTSLNGLVIR